MSYARWEPHSDVYVILNSGGYLECFCGDKSFACATTEAMIRHLEGHVVDGLKVPPHTFDRLRAEAERNDAWIRSRMKQGTTVEETK